MGDYNTHSACIVYGGAQVSRLYLYEVGRHIHDISTSGTIQSNTLNLILHYFL